MSNLQQILKEYLELSDSEIQEVINLVKEDWSAKLAQKISDDVAAELLNDFLGVPNWTKKDAGVV